MGRFLSPLSRKGPLICAWHIAIGGLAYVCARPTSANHPPYPFRLPRRGRRRGPGPTAMAASVSKLLAPPRSRHAATSRRFLPPRTSSARSPAGRRVAAPPSRWVPSGAALLCSRLFPFSQPHPTVPACRPRCALLQPSASKARRRELRLRRPRRRDGHGPRRRHRGGGARRRPAIRPAVLGHPPDRAEPAQGRRASRRLVSPRRPSEEGRRRRSPLGRNRGLPGRHDRCSAQHESAISSTHSLLARLVTKLN